MSAIPNRADVFPVGPPVDPQYQVGRLGDIERVAEALRGGDHVVLSDARRTGKSTVALAALQLIGQDVDPAPITIAINLHERVASSDELV